MSETQTRTTNARTYRVRFLIDEQAQFEESNGESRPNTEEEYRGNEYHNEGKPIPYADYLTYYGNPARHRYIGVIVDSICGCCKAVDPSAASLWNVDLMDDSPEWRYIETRIERAFTEEEVAALPGYLKDVAEETLSEARDH